MKILEQALDTVRTFRRMTAAQVKAILVKTKAAAARGKLFARERIALLADEGSFTEDGRYANALADGAHSVFTVPIAKGGKVLVPADKIAYVEFGGPEARHLGGRRGFMTHGVANTVSSAVA